jgi:hypothetical protein
MFFRPSDLPTTERDARQSARTIRHLLKAENSLSTSLATFFFSFSISFSASVRVACKLLRARACKGVTVVGARAAPLMFGDFAADVGLQRLQGLLVSVHLLLGDLKVVLAGLELVLQTLNLAARLIERSSGTSDRPWPPLRPRPQSAEPHRSS